MDGITDSVHESVQTLGDGEEQGSLAHCSAWGHKESDMTEQLNNSVSCVRAHSVVSDSVTPWTVARQAPLSMGFSRQEYWSGLPFPPPRDLPDPRIEPPSPEALALASRFFTTEPREARLLLQKSLKERERERKRNIELSDASLER